MKEESTVHGKAKTAEKNIKKGDKTINQVRADLDLPPIENKLFEKKYVSKE